MKKITFYLFLLILGVKQIYSQEYTLSSEILAAFVESIDGVKAVKNADGIKIYLGKKEKENQLYKISLKYDGQEESFILQPLTYPSFISSFKRNVKSILEKAIKDNAAKNSYKVRSVNHSGVLAVEGKIATLFARIVTAFNTDEERPQVATIYLKSNIPVYSDNSKKALNSILVGTLDNANAEITFYDGFIEKVQLKGTVKNQDVTFSNIYSIGISSTKNIKKLSSTLLYSEDKFNEDIILNNRKQIDHVLEKYLPKSPIADPTEKQKELTILFEQLYIKKYLTIDNPAINLLIADLKTKFEVNKKNEFEKSLVELFDEISEEEGIIKRFKNVSLKLYFSDAIRYVKKVDVNANDVSPEKQLVLLNQESRSNTKLYKEESTRLFEAVVYTDFLSLFDEENPNGLVQTEVNKRFNIKTRRRQVGGWGKVIPPFFPGLISEAYGFFQYFDAQFHISKIEKNNKFLESRTIMIEDEAGAMVNSEPFYEPLALLQHRNYAIGGMLNILNLENQNAKLNMYLDAGFLFGRSGYIPIGEDPNAETVNTQFVNNIEIPIEYKFHLLPEKRFSIMLSDKLSWFENLDADIPLRSIEDKLVTSQNRWINSFNVNFNLDISSTGRLFIRYKLLHELDNINNNFSQLQFGYSFYFLKNNKPGN
ncbi:hypothetical protein D1818_01110 [Aquimarina sp. BL5]|uniref:hypothetical protein n=1 Tax=Aquimarina sp. BL5 TaxID=1714860 RepID=UPI000E493732|nr:hypothetical protein [Aquimarina sp. BL5]AXT49485.1 hypothetical protein D1818_01110 [Aquimarina sp. BL5]RKN04381.1 hypothetical protein D7036_12355 [Aquimarina sp. BL5]